MRALRTEYTASRNGLAACQSDPQASRRLLAGGFERVVTRHSLRELNAIVKQLLRVEPPGRHPLEKAARATATKTTLRDCHTRLSRKFALDTLLYQS